MDDFYFYSANGIHYEAYRLIFNELNNQPTVFHYPILDQFPGEKGAPFSWTMFSDVIDQTIQNKQNIGIGHSSGATALLYHAILNPDAWKTIFIMEPALFSPPFNFIYRIIRTLRLENQLHPMIRITKKRRDQFDSIEGVIKRWRNYPTFRQFSDKALGIFVRASIQEDDGIYSLRFPKKWEIEIYRNMCVLDPVIWKNLRTLQSKLIVIAGQTSNTFLSGARRLLKRHADEFIEIPNTTHLVPFESPRICAKIINHHMS